MPIYCGLCGARGPYKGGSRRSSPPHPWPEPPIGRQYYDRESTHMCRTCRDDVLGWQREKAELDSHITTRHGTRLVGTHLASKKKQKAGERDGTRIRAGLCPSLSPPGPNPFHKIPSDVAEQNDIMSDSEDGLTASRAPPSATPTPTPALDTQAGPASQSAPPPAPHRPDPRFVNIKYLTDEVKIAEIKESREKIASLERERERLRKECAQLRADLHAETQLRRVPPTKRIIHAHAC